MNVQMRVYVLRTFVTHLLVHMHQKEKIALEIAAKIASVNRPFSFLSNSCFGRLGSPRAGPPREDCSRLGKQFADWDTMIYRLPVYLTTGPGGCFTSYHSIGNGNNGRRNETTWIENWIEFKLDRKQWIMLDNTPLRK